MEDDKLENFMNAIGIHSIAPEPESLMSSWRIFEVQRGGRSSRHLVGRADWEGRVSTSIVKIDPMNMCVKTGSGRVYQLVGPSCHDDDAEYVWGRWMRLSGATNPRDITRVFLRLTRILGGKL